VKSLAKETDAVLAEESQEISADASGSDEFSDYTYEAEDYSETYDYVEEPFYPSEDESDVRALEGDLEQESTDATEVASDVKGSQPTGSAVARLKADQATAEAAAAAVRQDVGGTATPSGSTPGSASSTTPTSVRLGSGASTSTTLATGAPPTAAESGSTTTTPVTAPSVLDEQGSGTTTTEQFSVPRAAKGWTLKWTYDCSSLGSSGNFVIDVNGHGRSLETKDVGPDELGVGGTDTEHYFDDGSFSLEIASECPWTVQVTAVG
jgi:hypothetical protein